MGVNVQITLGFDVEIDQAMTGNLIQHVIKERHAGGKFALTGTIQIEAHNDLRLQGVARNFGLPHRWGLNRLLNRRP
jgi:hypothetical protein